MTSWAGRLLVATPVIEEDAFRRAVVLLLQHDREGALGVVVSRPSPVAVDDVLPGWQALCGSPCVVFSGGPVQTDAAMCLARRRPDGPPLGPAALQLVPSEPSLAVVDLDAEPEVVAAAVSRARIFAGYAGWAAEQLEEEVGSGAWWVLDALPEDAFSREPRRLWRGVLRRQPGRLALAATLPEDPSQN